MSNNAIDKILNELQQGNYVLINLSWDFEEIYKLDNYELKICYSSRRNHLSLWDMNDKEILIDRICIDNLIGALKAGEERSEQNNRIRDARKLDVIMGVV